MGMGLIVGLLAVAIALLLWLRRAAHRPRAQLGTTRKAPSARPAEAAGVFLSLGSNLGDRALNLQRARAAIGALPGTRLVRCSGVRETRAWGVTDQPDFLNQVVEIATTLSPRDLLAALKRLERELGRVETYRWGPRVIDMDIVAYGRLAVNEPDLVIPHPRCTAREFVLEPLRELAPEVARELLAGTWVQPGSKPGSPRP